MKFATRLLSVALAGAISAAPARALIECDNEPDLSRRVRESTLIVVAVGEFVGEQRDSHGNAFSDPLEEGRIYGPMLFHVRLKVTEVLKGKASAAIDFTYEAQPLALNGCSNPMLTPGTSAVFFLAGAAPSFQLVGGAYGIDDGTHGSGLNHFLGAVRKELSR